MKKIDILSEKPELIQNAIKTYKYQEKLTQVLDNYKDKDFTIETLLQIVLWKVNRYAYFEDGFLAKINDLRTNYSIEKARQLLAGLLAVKGVNLPMASTILRFACPYHFQIIDKCVYRFITPDATTLKLPKTIAEKIELYFDYLARLRETCLKYDISFNEADRILYQIDKTENKKCTL